MIMNPRVLIVALALLFVVAGGLFLATHAAHATQHKTEKEISNARFFK